MGNVMTRAYDSIAAALGGMATATVTRGRDAIPGCIAVGIDRMRETDETGRVIGVAATVRMKKTQEPDKPITHGEIISILMDGYTDAVKARVIGRNDVAGLIRLTVSAEFE